MATDGTTEMRYSSGSSDAIVAKVSSSPGYLKENGTTGNATVKDIDGETSVGRTRLIRLYVSGKGKLTINCNGTNGEYKVLDGSTSGTTLISQLSANTQSSEITVTNFLWVETTKKGYINTIVWSPTAAADAAPETPIFTPDGGDKDGRTTVTIASINASKIFYVWTNSSEAPAVGDASYTEATGGSCSVSVPNETNAAKYLHAYGWNTYNTESTSDIYSKSFNITKVKDPAGLVYGTTSVIKEIGDGNFINTLTNPHSLTVNYESSDEDVATIASNGEVTIVGIGSTTITASSAATDDYLAGDATYTLSVKAPLTGVSSRFWKVSDTNWLEGDYNLELIGSHGDLRDVYQAGADNIDGKTFAKEVKVSAGTGNAFHFKVNGHTKVTAYGRSNNDKGTNANIYVGSISGSASVTSSWTKTAAGKIEYYNTTDGVQDIFICGTGKEWDFFGVKVAPYVNVSITTGKEYVTFNSDEKLDFTGQSTITAYTAEVAENIVTLSKVTEAVPENTGLLLRGETPGVSSNIEVAESANTPTNDFIAITTEGGEYVKSGYVLATVDGVQGFYRANTSSGTFVSKGKAYLPAAVDAARLTMVFDDEEGGELTGISLNKREATASDRYFNLSGQRVAQPTKGLYIVNGKKVIVK